MCTDKLYKAFAGAEAMQGPQNPQWSIYTLPVFGITAPFVPALDTAQNSPSEIALYTLIHSQC